MKRNLCPLCGGTTRIELSINFFVCNKCSETLYADELVRECAIEFGEHEHDDEECEITLNSMQAVYDMTPEYDMQQGYYEQLGRPAFPNEY